MSTATQAQNKAPNLAGGEFPRSPNELIGPYVILARTIDKCRAAIVGTAGEYHWDCPLAMMLFDWKGIDPQAFKQQVEAGNDDEAIMKWLHTNGHQKSDEEILAWSYDCRWATPQDVGKKAYVETTLRAIGGKNPPYAQSFFQMLDVEEGRDLY